MKINKKQKITIIASAAVIIIVFIVWLLSGSYVFTQTRVLIEKKDPLFGSTYKQWKDKFILGLDLTLVITFLSLVISSVLVYIFKDKRKELNEKSN
jgi:uncharacterized protein YpmB